MGPSGGFGWDNTDVRLAYHTNVFGGDTVYGLTLNNNPTVQDLWDTTPAWRFPWTTADTDNGAAPATSYAAQIDGTLGQTVVGLGAYAMVNGHLYVEADAYRQAFSSGGPRIDNFAPYWRVAWQQDFGPNYLEVGTFGMYTKLSPNGSSGPVDEYTDVGVDSQFSRPVTGGNVVAHLVYIYERANPAIGRSMTGNTFRLDGTYNYGHRAETTAQYFQTTGSSLLLGGGESRGYILQASYLPWENTKFTLQYTGYTSFDGLSTSASDNNTLYLLAWLMY